MADNVQASSEKEKVPDPPLPDLASNSSSSDDATSTQSTEAKTPDDVETLHSEKSYSTPAKHSSEDSNSQEETSRRQSPQVELHIPPSDKEGSSGDENEGLIPRRRVRDQASDVEVQEDELVSEQVVDVEPARRSPTSRRFITSLTRGFENSNEYVINFLLTWQAYSIFLSDSKYLVFVQLALIGVSIANVGIGAVYLQSCPSCLWLPGLVLALGMIGILLMVIRLMLVLHKNYSTQEIFTKFFRKIIFMLNIAYIAFLTWEFTEYIMCRNAQPVGGQSGYCNPFLMSYVKGYNCAAFIIVFISLILHGPAYLQYSWNIGGPGLPDSTA